MKEAEKNKELTGKKENEQPKSYVVMESYFWER